MAIIKLASLFPSGDVDLVHNVDEALEAVGCDEYKDLVPVVILRHHELRSLDALTIEQIRTDLEEAAIGSKGF